jgi:hypothetical protein
MKKVDYDHLQNQIMGALQVITDNRAEMDIADSYGELIDFLETMYCNSILALVGSLLATAKYTDDIEVSREGLLAARAMLEAPKTHVHDKLMNRYYQMIQKANLPDLFQEKTHNEQVSEAIKRELDQPGT